MDISYSNTISLVKFDPSRSIQTWAISAILGIARVARALGGPCGSVCRESCSNQNVFEILGSSVCCQETFLVDLFSGAGSA